MQRPYFINRRAYRKFQAHTRKIALGCAFLAPAFWPSTASADPVLRMTTDLQCPVTLETSSTGAINESPLAALGSALLGSAADMLLDAGVSYLKTKLDPSQGQYIDKVSIPHSGKYLEAGHNPELNCLIIAVFDRDEPGRASLPLKDHAGKRIVNPKAKFSQMSNLENANVNERIKYLFSENIGNPILYLEVVRRYSPDLTAYYYEPVYAYADRLINPNFFSKDPTWEISISWKSINGETEEQGVYRFSGKPPFERGAGELNLQGQGWISLVTPQEANSANAIWSPFTIVLDVKEHRSATLFAKALQKAIAENEDALKQAVRDGYPWRQKEVKEAALEKSKMDARTKLEAYLTDLENFNTTCIGTLNITQQTRCGISYIKLVASHEAALDATSKVKILPVDFEVPQPPKFVLSE